MLDELFLPDNYVLNLEEIHIDPTSVVVRVSSFLDEAICPYCKASANRLHSRYHRTLADLPCGERTVQILWLVRRFFCDNPNCPYLTFGEQYPGIATPYARRTQRLWEKQLQIGFEMGGEAGRRVAELFNLRVSGDSIIRFVRSIPDANLPIPRVLGVDDWAKKKGHTYGTILVDLEKQQVVDLLPDRKPETLAAWLLTRPGIEIISRDRGKEYIEGINLGNPGVIQVADRFHLLKNMVEMLQRLFERCSADLQQAAKENSSQPSIPPTLTDDRKPDFGEDVQKQSTPKNTYQQARFDEVKRLQEQGVGQRAIARQVGLARQTVQKYLHLEKLPKKSQRSNRYSKAAPFINFIAEHWDQDIHSVKQLLEELQAQGFTGSYSSLNRAIHSQLGVDNLKTTHQPYQRPLIYTPRQAAWAIFRPEIALKDHQKSLCQTLCKISPVAFQAHQLAQAFREMIGQKQHDRLDEWIQEAEESHIVEFVRFARGIRKDYAAIKAALTYSWSNGQLEGQVNRLKLIKRQMYGRAGFQLLRKRVLGPPLIA